MPVIGAVLHLDQNPEQRERALQYLNQHPRITLGHHQDGRLPIVLESDSKSEDKALWNELQAQSGVTFCSVVFADFSDVNLEETA